MNQENIVTLEVWFSSLSSDIEIFQFLSKQNTKEDTRRIVAIIRYADQDEKNINYYQKIKNDFQNDKSSLEGNLRKNKLFYQFYEKIIAKPLFALHFQNFK